MASLGMQMLGSILALMGWVGVLLACILPMWRVTAFIGMTIVTSETMWEGIWMTCVVQSTGHMQCKPYESMLALTSDLKAAQFLTIGSILTGALGLILAFVGGKCTRFLDYKSKPEKARVATAAGVALIMSGLLCLIPVSWSAVAVVQIFHNPQMTDSQRRELGAAIYIGWGASILLFLGGGMLCSTSCSSNDESQSVEYRTVLSSRAGSGIRGSQQVRILRPAQNGHSLGRSEQSDEASANQRQNKTALDRSMSGKASSTKSQLIMDKSDQSDVPSTKSGSSQSWTASQLSESASVKHEKTYL
ncbi:claudin-4-like [Trichomycterus rosablanca]|uniref:claudin-4-like n=1 Tax=Trichomycterus rosablanca TaxID=2290929 RepID=UPI002F3557C7